MIKNIIRKITPKRIKDFLIYTDDLPFQNIIYSQEGEDLLLDLLMEYPSSGTYVDIGAHHPFKFSNSFYFYKKGISGICVDPRQGISNLFANYRERDIFLNIGVAENKSNMPYYVLNDHALNTFSKSMLEIRLNQGYSLIEKKEIDLIPLSSVLDNHLDKTKKLLFFTIDVENFELDVLKSNNWEKYRPLFVLSHFKSKNIENNLSSEMTLYLKEKGYELCAKSYNSVFYKNIL